MWLKKGYDFVRSGKSFNDETAVVDLGVGKNMVASIKFWLKSFGIIDEENNTTRFGDLILTIMAMIRFLRTPIPCGYFISNLFIHIMRHYIGRYLYTSIKNVRSFLKLISSIS